MKEKSNVLSKADLQQMVERSSGNLAQLMAQQNTALMLLSGTTAAFMAANSGILNSALAAVITQGSLMSAQLGCNQTALDNAANMNMLINTLSGNIEGMLEGFAALVDNGKSMAGNMDKVVPLVDQIANSGGGINDAANTVFGGIGALGAVGDAGRKLSKIGTTLGVAGKTVGLLGGFLSGPVAPLLLGGLAVAGVGTMAYKAYKNYKAKQKDSADPEFEKKVMEATSYENPPYQPPAQSAQSSVTERDLMAMDPVVLGAADDMFSPPQARPTDERLPTAANAAAYDRPELAVTELTAEISGLKYEIHKLVEKPFDPNVRAEVVIQSLRTNMTYREFEEAIEKKFKDDLAVSSMPMWI